MDSNNNLAIPISLIYMLLRSGIAKLRGRSLVVSEDISTAKLRLEASDIIPEVKFCPEEMPSIIDVDDVLKNMCVMVYKYFEDRCAACAIKVFSILGNEWLVDERALVKLFEIARDFNLPLQWSMGCIILTTCPEDYGEVREQLKPGDYIKGLDRIRRALLELQKRI